MTEWTLDIYEIGKIKFKTGRAGFGEKLYRAEERATTQHFCPECNTEIKGHLDYYCDACGKHFTAHEVIKKKSGKNVIQKERTLALKVNVIVNLDTVPRSLIDLRGAVYLKPIDNFENIVNLNEFIKLLLDNDGLAITTKARAKKGSPDRAYGIFIDSEQQGLVMAEILDPTRLIEIPDFARYKEKYVKNADEVAKAKAKLYKAKFKGV